jgi:hypothetical protein
MLLGWSKQVDEMDEACSAHVAKILGRKVEGKRLLGRSGRKWEDYIKVFHSGIGCEGVDCI